MAQPVALETVMSQHEATARTLLAEALAVPVDSITEDASIESEAEWTSLSHMGLLLRLEAYLEATLDPESVLEITSLRGITAFLERCGRDG